MISYFESKNVILKTIYSSPHKACFAENGIWRIKRKLYAAMVDKNTLRWIELLPQVTKSLNATFMKSIGMAPAEVTFSNANIVRQRLWTFDNGNRKKPIFKIGDKVRVINPKQVFQPGYYSRWSDEILTVYVVERSKKPITYRVIADDGQILRKQFYGTELCKVKQDSDTIYRIEVLKERKNKNGQKELYIHYIGYNEYKWVLESEII